jgi:hypothetical protein
MRILIVVPMPVNFIILSKSKSVIFHVYGSWSKKFVHRIHSQDPQVLLKLYILHLSLKNYKENYLTPPLSECLFVD